MLCSTRYRSANFAARGSNTKSQFHWGAVRSRFDKLSTNGSSLLALITPFALSVARAKSKGERLLMKRQVTKVTTVQFPQSRDITGWQRFAADGNVGLGLLDGANPWNHRRHHRIAQDKA